MDKGSHELTLTMAVRALWGLVPINTLAVKPHFSIVCYEKEQYRLMEKCEDSDISEYYRYERAEKLRDLICMYGLSVQEIVELASVEGYMFKYVPEDGDTKDYYSLKKKESE